MSDQWYYRMFGEDFGPVPFEKLREMADKGTVGADDEVRSESSHRWVTAGSVDGLGLSSQGGGAAVATKDHSDPAIDVSTTRAGLDDWYCMLHGNELGPLSFEELVKFAEHDNLSADDEVKLGANGKWRRVGSIGRLVAVLPYRAVESKTPATKLNSAMRSKTPAAEQLVIELQDNSATAQMATVETASQIDVQATYQAAYEQAKAQIAESMMAQAEAAFKEAEESAKAELAWAFAPNTNPEWWGWMGGVEFGPVGFMQVFALAKNGQLKPSDFVRNGPTGQYFPSSSAPGLFNAVATVAKAAETLKLAKVQAQAAASLASPPPLVPVQVASKPTPVVTPTAMSGVTRPTPQENLARTQPNEATATKRVSTKSTPEMAVISEPPKRTIVSDAEPVEVEVKESKPVEARYAPASSPMSGGYSSSMSSSSSAYASRPVSVPVRPAPRPASSRSSSSSSLSDSIEFLKDPKALGAMGVVAALLLFIGWGYLPKNSAADFKHFRELKQVYDDIKAQRSGKSDIVAVMKQAERVSKTITADLAKKASRDNPAKQSLLWAARDQLPNVISELKKAPAVPSKAEENFAARLWEAANQLGLKDTGLPAPTPAPEIASKEVKPGFPDD